MFIHIVLLFYCIKSKNKKAIFDAPFFIMFEMYYLKFKILYIPFWKKRVIYYKIWGFFRGGGLLLLFYYFIFLYLWQENVFLKG